MINSFSFLINLYFSVFLLLIDFIDIKKETKIDKKRTHIKTKNKSNHKIMSKGDVINFMQTYQRITENMFKNMPKYASIILNLNSNHQIKSAVYKSK